MTVGDLKHQLSKFPDDAEVLIPTGEDSRDNTVYLFPYKLYGTEAGELDNEAVSMQFEDDQAIVVIETEE